MLEKNMVKKFIVSVVLVFIVSGLFAKDLTDYFSLAEKGTAQEIQNTFKAKPNLKNQVFGDNRETFLMLCLKNNRLQEVIKVCLIAECNVMAKAKDGRTPIMYAAQYTNNVSVLESVIKSGTLGGVGVKKRVQQADSSKKTAFDYAKENQYFDAYSVLLKFGEDPAVEAQKKKEQKEAKKAAKSKKSASEKESVKENNNETAEDISVPEENEDQSDIEEPAESFAAENAEKEEVKQEEIKRVTKEPQEATPLVIPSNETAETDETDDSAEIAAAAETVPDETSYLKKQKDQIKEYAQTFLYDYAEEVQAPEETKSAKKYVENPNLQDADGVSLLMKAAKSGNDWDVRNLLASGADVQLRDKDGWTALMYAVRYQNNMNIVNMLVEKGAYIRVRNKYNATPLLLAADYSQNPEILEFLLKGRSVSEDEVFKAFIFAITGNTVSDHIRNAKVQLFLDRDIQINRVWKGKTPLMYAAQYSSSTAVIQMLLENGAKPGIRDQNGLTAFDYAKANSRLAHDNIYWALNSSIK